MAYFKDLSPYEYFPGESDTLNVGWLSRDHGFPRGPVSLAFVDELHRFSKTDVITRGHHVCEFCDPPVDVIASDERYRGVWEYFRSGNGEIRIVAVDGVVYSAPSLMLHYISISLRNNLLMQCFIKDPFVFDAPNKSLQR
jgi:hypothetical protein